MRQLYMYLSEVGSLINSSILHSYRNKSTFLACMFCFPNSYHVMFSKELTFLSFHELKSVLHDIVSAILVNQNNKTTAMLVF